jgi:hypothetical protein
MTTLETDLPSNDITAGPRLAMPPVTWEPWDQVKQALEVCGRLFIQAAAELGHVVYPHNESDVIYVAADELVQTRQLIEHKVYEIAGRNQKPKPSVPAALTKEELADKYGHLKSKIGADPQAPEIR